MAMTLRIVRQSLNAQTVEINAFSKDDACVKRPTMAANRAVIAMKVFVKLAVDPVNFSNKVLSELCSGCEGV